MEKVLEFDLEVYQGPLELLLYLIKKNEIDLKDIPISIITEQYLAILDKMNACDIEITGEFLVMAAKLVYWKTIYLLPTEKRDDDMEDPSGELATLIREYERFKNAAEILAEKNKQMSDLFTRVDESSSLIFKNVEEEFVVDLYKMLEAFTNVMDRLKKTSFEHFKRDEVKIEDKMEWILAKLAQCEFLRFEDCFMSGTRIELVAIFLAVLELVRLKKIRASQPAPFAEIRIYLSRDDKDDRAEEPATEIVEDDNK